MNVTATLFGQMITFAVLVWFVNRVLWGPLTEVMAGRTRRIAEGLKAGENGRLQEQMARAEADRLIAAARDTAGEILAQARERQAEIVLDAKREARIEAARLLAVGEAEVARKADQAREQLRRELAGLVVEGAGRLMAAEMDAGRHAALIDDLAARL